MISRDAAKERGDVVAWLEEPNQPAKYKEAAKYFARLIRGGAHAGRSTSEFYPEDYDLDT